MKQTFPDRRQLILSTERKVTVADVENEYPLLFNEKEVIKFSIYFTVKWENSCN